jgi:hypothetical protein
LIKEVVIKDVVIKDVVINDVVIKDVVIKDVVIKDVVIKERCGRVHSDSRVASLLTYLKKCLGRRRPSTNALE